MTTLEGDRLYEVTDHHAGKDGCNIWLRLISYRRKIEILLIEYEQILCKLLCEVLYTLIEVSGVTDGLYKHEWNIIIGYLERPWKYSPEWMHPELIHCISMKMQMLSM